MENVLAVPQTPYLIVITKLVQAHRASTLRRRHGGATGIKVGELNIRKEFTDEEGREGWFYGIGDSKVVVVGFGPYDAGFREFGDS
ncbi:hypothetical protein Lal_00030575 [Lupinus albus]|nr:hypothetical protein Lal_00030575 [Lupinus albus]